MDLRSQRLPKADSLDGINGFFGRSRRGRFDPLRASGAVEVGRASCHFHRAWGRRDPHPLVIPLSVATAVMSAPAVTVGIVKDECYRHFSARFAQQRVMLSGRYALN